MMINKRLVRMVDGSIRYVLCNVAAQWAGLCANIVAIIAIGRLLDAALRHAVDTASIVITCTVVAVCVAVRMAGAMLSARYSHQSSERVKLSLREAIFQKLLRLGPAYTEQVSTSEAVQFTVEGVDQLEIYFGKYLPQLVYSLLAPVTLFAVLAWINLPAAAVLLACVPLIPLSIVAVQRFAKKLLARYWGRYTTLGDSFLENLQGLTTLKIYGSDAAKNDEMNEKAEDFRRVTMRVLVMQLNSITVMDLIAYGGAALGIIIAAGQMAAGHIGFLGGFCVILLAADFFIPLRMLGSYFHIAMNGMAAGDKILRLLDMPEREAAGTQAPDAAKGICLKDVTFGYDNTRTVLQGITLRAGPGLTAIVGESGCGKSTIAALLCGANTAYTGSVRLGGAEVSETAGEAISRHITLVPHNGYLFKGTVRDNLLMAKVDAGEAALWSALERANLSAFLRGAQGLDTPVAERGANLSGGQGQRLALARALLHDTPVYVFDEATSNIDVESESDIISAIWALSREKTIIMISHRLANVIPASMIYTLKDGRIAEQGTHQTLLAQGGLYARMYATQQALEGAGKKEAAHA